ncbi:MAG TPA: PAS domain-containing protein [Actinomycetota bacterium]|nr:PAS domain-containing protein [Actinomycetota bacterium]
MVETAGIANAARRDAALEAVSFAAERLLLSADWRDAAHEVLERFGLAAGVSRIHLIENAVVDGEVRITLASEWCAPGVRSFLLDTALDGLPWEPDHHRWVEMMRTGEAVVGSVESFPEVERPALRAQEIVSLAYFPVTVDGEWWGCIGFDDCERDRDWTFADLDGLRTAATLLGAAIGRRRQEDRLRSADARYRSVLERIPAVTYVDVKTAEAVHMAFVSPQIEALLGHANERFLLDPEFWFELVHPEDRERVDAAAIEAGQTGVTFDQEYRMRHADEHWVWVHDTSMPVAGDDGEVSHFQGFMIDVTGRKEAEERLREAERRYRSMVEAIPAITYIDQPNGGPAGAGADVTFLSPQIEQVLGYPVARFMEDPSFWFSLIHPDDLQRLQGDSTFSVDDVAPFDQTYRMRQADGRWVWVHDTSTAVFGDEGQLAYFQGFMVDVTEGKEAEEQLREAEETFRTIVEQNPALIYTQTAEPGVPRFFRTTYISPRHDLLFGYEPEEILADPSIWGRVIYPDDRERVLAPDAGEETGERSDEFRIIAKDGGISWVQDQARLVRMEGRPAFWQGFLLDVTERKHAEEHLARALVVEREAASRLRALDDMKNTFLQAVSHDLRTPLAAILGLAITLERGDVHLEEVEARDLARRIAENARRLDRLVTNLLDLDRLARGIVTPKLEPVDVGALVRRVLAESELIADSRLRTDIAEIVVPVDPAKIERVIENLIANTARHTPESSTVWVTVRPVTDGVLILVEDDGPGVAPELRQTIFEPFQQGPDAPQHSPGVGVGLTLVARFAEIHGGSAWVDEREGGGASFRVFLPSGPAGLDDGPVRDDGMVHRGGTDLRGAAG